MGAACSYGVQPPAEPCQAPVAPAAPAPRAPACSSQRSLPRGRVLSEATGDVRDTYALGEHLGDGSYGTVVLARHRAVGASRAVKTVSKKGHLAVTTLRREIAALRRMDHENVIKLFDVFEDTDCVYLAMELASGSDFFDRLTQCSRFSERHSALMIRQALCAVEYLHDSDIVHRDLKLENFVLARTGPLEGNTLKLIDFGLARDCVEGEVLRSRVGTAAYMSPQVAYGKYDRRCDIWSVGVMLYLMLSGRLPVHGNSDSEILRRIKEGRWDFTASIWTPVSCEAKSLVRALMRRKADDRISATAALSHPWLLEQADSDESSTCCARPRAASEASTTTPKSTMRTLPSAKPQ